MPDARGWPDPARPGFPEHPYNDGPHLIQDANGRRWAWWTFLAEAWQLPSPSGTIDLGLTVLPELAAKQWTYLGPATAPDGKPVS